LVYFVLTSVLDPDLHENGRPGSGSALEVLITDPDLEAMKQQNKKMIIRCEIVKTYFG